MRKSWIVPGCTVLVGLAGALLRRKQLACAFEASGLAARGSMQTAALVGVTVLFCAAALAVAALLTRGRETDGGFVRAFGVETIPGLVMSGVFVLAALVGAVTVLAWKGTPPVGWGVPVSGVARWVFVIFAVGTGLGLLVMTLTGFAGRDRQAVLLASVVPSIFYCFWLVLLYRDNLGNPVLMKYSFGCLGFAFAALSFYYIAGFAFGRKKSGCVVFCSLSAMYFLCVTLADAAWLPLRLFLVGTVGFLAVCVGVLLDRLEPRQEDGESGGESEA